MRIQRGLGVSTLSRRALLKSTATAGAGLVLPLPFHAIAKGADLALNCSANPGDGALGVHLQQNLLETS